MSGTSYRRLIDVETTSCFHWVGCLVSNCSLRRLSYFRTALIKNLVNQLKYSGSIDFSVVMVYICHFSFNRFISKGIAWISNGILYSWSSLVGKVPLTKTKKPPLFAVTSYQNGLWKSGIKNYAVKKEVCCLVSGTIRISVCSKSKFV